MKKYFFIIVLTQIGYNAIGQTEQLESKSAIREEKLPRQQNLWVDSGSGNRPRL